MIPRLDLIAYVAGALILVGVAWWAVEAIGDRREAEIERKLEEARRETQAALDVAADRLATAEAANRALAQRLADSRMGVENENRATDPCRPSPGLLQRLEGRWGPPPAPVR